MTTDEPKGGGFTVSDPEPDPEGLPRIDFTTFVLSLATSGMVHMGLAELPESEKVEANLALARQTIDTLEMLQAKTQGNLEKEEAQLLQSILYELRMGFVKAKAQQSGEKADEPSSDAKT